MDGSDKTNTTLSCPNELALILIYVCVRARFSPPVDNKNSKLRRIQKKGKKNTKCRPNFENNVIKIGRRSEPLMTYHTCIRATAHSQSVVAIVGFTPNQLVFVSRKQSVGVIESAWLAKKSKID